MKVIDRLKSLCHLLAIFILIVGTYVLAPAQEPIKRTQFTSGFGSFPLPQHRSIHHFPAPFDDPSFPFSDVTIDAETPDWAVLLYDPDPNILEIKELYDTWKRTQPYVKNGHTRNFRKLYTYLIEHRGLNEEGYIQLRSTDELRGDHEKALTDRVRFVQRQNKDLKKSANNTEWSLMGPIRMERSSGEDANIHINIYSIDQSLSDPDVLYAASESGGTIFKTIDKGDHWYSVSDSLVDDMGPRELAVAPSSSDIVYFGAKRRIYKTTDGGVEWSVIYDPGTIVQPNSILVHPTDPDIIISGSLDGIIKSADGGMTWTTVLPTKYVYDLRYKPGDPSTVYALMDNIITRQTDFYKSTDGGDSWTVRTTGWPDEISTANKGGRMTTSDGHPHIIFAFIGATWDGVTDKRGVKVMKSSDSGETWTTKINWTDSGVPNFPDSGQGFYDWDIEMSDVDSNLVLLGTQGRWLTTDGFESKTFNVDVDQSQLGHADVQKILFNGNDLWVANDGGIIKFDDATFQNYKSKSNGISAISFWSFDQGWNRDAQVGTHYHNGTSVRTDTYESGAYINHGGAEPSFSLLAAPNADKMVSKGYGSVNGKTLPDDQLAPVTSFSYNIVPNQEGYDGTSMTTMPSAHDTHFVGLKDSVMRSDDFGRTWEALAGSTHPDEYVRGVSLTRAHDSTMYVITDHGLGGKLYHSLDLGASFTTVDQPVGFVLRNAEISISNSQAEEVYLAGRSRVSGPKIKIAKSTDRGATWTDLWTNTLSGYDFRKVLHIDGTDGGVYLLTTKAVFYRNNTMSDWVWLSEGIPPNATLQYMKPFYKEGEIRIAGSRGVFGAELYETPVMSDMLLQPTVPRSQYECAKDTIYFDDYSVLNHNGAAWSWTFPGATYVSDASARNPKVVYALSGKYDVTMSVTQDGQTYTKTVSDMITIGAECDSADDIAGSAITLDKTSDDRVYTDDFNLITNTLTITAWIKPQGNQEGFTGIVSNGAWCAHCNHETLGLIWNYWGNHLYYRWPGSTSGWADRSDIQIPLDEWSYVAMVMGPDSVVLHLNEERWVQYITHAPADISNLYIGLGHYNKDFNGEIDEVAIWKRSLSDIEVRKWMHLTKDPSADPDLIAYYQFNEEEGQAINKSGNYHASLLNGTSRLISTAPLGSGKSNRQVEIDGVVSFTDTRVEAEYSSHVSAEVVASVIEHSPYNYQGLQGGDLPLDSQYWAMHRYRAGDLDMNLTLEVAEDLTMQDAATLQRIALYGRGSRSDEAWQYLGMASNIDPTADKATFSQIRKYDQYLIAKAEGPILRASESVTLKNTVVGDVSEESSYTFSAANLTGDAFMTAPEGFEISLREGSDFSNSLIMSPNVGAIAEITIYVRYTPDAIGLLSGEITLSSDGASEKSISVSGLGFQLDRTPGYALLLDGGSDHVNLGNPEQLQITGDLTIQMWLRPSDFDERRNPIGKAYGGEYTITQEMDGTLTFYYGQSGSNSGGYQQIGSNEALLLNEWNHITVIRDFGSGQLSWYINGRLTNQTTTNYASAVAGSNEVYIGEGYVHGYAGMIDEVRIWEAALDVRQVREQMHHPLQGNEEGLVACYQFNESSGDAIDYINDLGGSLRNEATRTTATQPMGPGVSTTALETDGLVDFGASRFKVDYTSQSGDEVVVSIIEMSPDQTPVDLPRIFNQQYWVVHQYEAGAFIGDVTFTITDNLSVADRSNPSDLLLFGRAAYSDNTWVLIDSAEMVDPTIREITFQGLASFDQFLLAAHSDGMGTDCLTDVNLENTNAVPLLLGSTTFIKAGNLSGHGDVTIQGGASHIFEAKDDVSLERGLSVLVGTGLIIQIEDCALGG